MPGQLPAYHPHSSEYIPEALLCEGLCSTGYLVRTTEHLLRSQLDTTHYRTQLLDKAFNGMLNGHEIALEGHVCLDGQIPLRKGSP